MRVPSPTIGLNTLDTIFGSYTLCPCCRADLRVTQYRDNELYPSGYWTNQSFGNAGGVQSMVARKDNVEQDDIVLWSTYALTHNPRVEDCERR